MRVALVNPPWSFEDNVYFGCREPHLALGLGYTRALLQQRGHEVRLLDAQLAFADLPALANELEIFRPEATVISTAPSCQFWQCTPPALRVHSDTVNALRPHAGRLFAVGPDASNHPRDVLLELDVDAVVLGESEQVVPDLVEAEPADYARLGSIAFPDFRQQRTGQPVGGADHARRAPPVVVNGGPAVVDLAVLPALRWPEADVKRHAHHHHRFDRPPNGPGAEMEVARGCSSSSCTCRQQPLQSQCRKRSLDVVLDELDALCAVGARYVYFVDEAFMPDRALCEALVERPIEFGVQLHIGDWSKEMLQLLARAGCVSIEAPTGRIVAEQSRVSLEGRLDLGPDESMALLAFARRHVPFVQANLSGTSHRPRDIAAWRTWLSRQGVWSSVRVAELTDPGSPEYWLRGGARRSTRQQPPEREPTAATTPRGAQLSIGSDLRP